MTQPILRLEYVTKQFDPAAPPAVDGISLTLAKGDILGLLGPSGCGKTTLLRLMAGFEQPQSGAIAIADRVVAAAGQFVPPEQRDVGMVFQDYALFPHLTVAQNVAFGLHKEPTHRKKQERVSEVLTLVGMESMANRYPHQLSGGQQQRVALARALAPNPCLMLLDEPLSNLDVQIRLRLRQDIRDILKRTQMSAVFVTHDREEALCLCDRVAVIRQGRIEQLDTPEHLYQNPASRFVAEFVTQANLLPARYQNGQWETEIGAIAPSEPPEIPIGEAAIRQEVITLHPSQDSGKDAGMVICDRQFLGRDYRYCLQTPLGNRLYALVPGDVVLPVGSAVRLSFPAETARIFPAT